MLKRAVLAVLIVGKLAGAEVRVINASGTEISVDVLSQKGQTSGTKFQAEPNSGQVIGPKMPPKQPVMIVIHGPDGSEAYREKAESGQILMVKKWNPYLTNPIGVMGGKPNNSYPHVVNGTGQKVDYEITYPDMTNYTGALEGPDGNTTAQHNDLGRSGNAGDVLNVKFTLSDGSPPVTIKLTAGTVYYLNSKLAVEKLGTQ